MQFLFGWSKSAIQQWIPRIIRLIGDVFAKFRAFPSIQEQYTMVLEHITFLKTKSATLLQSYGKRLNFGKAADAANRVFQGAIGAVDGTFTICCSFPGDGIQDLMYIVSRPQTCMSLCRYTGYKKYHAWKLLVVCSLFTKVILAIIVRPATVADGMCWGLDEVWAPLLAKSLFLLGDAAFNGILDIIPPYRTEDINLTRRYHPTVAALMREFNQVQTLTCTIFEFFFFRITAPIV